MYPAAGEPPNDPARVAIELGRHQAFAAIREVGRPDRLIPLGASRAGVVLRWRQPRGCQRVTDRLMLLVEHDERAARELAVSIASVVIQPLRSHLDAGASLTVAIPPALGPLSRRAIRSGFEAAGAFVEPSDLVERPIAALASWAGRIDANPDAPLASDLVLALDDDAGELSAVVADISAKRLLACAPLSIGPDDDPFATEQRMRDLVSTAVETRLAWQATESPANSVIGRIVLSGSGAAHPELRAMVRRAFPSVADGHQDATDDPYQVVLGALRLDALAPFRRSWSSPAGAIPPVE